MSDSDNRKRLKVLRIISRLNIGGPSIHVSLLCRKLNPEKFESVLIVGALSPSEGDMSYLIKEKIESVRSISKLQREIDPVKDVFVLFNLLRIFFKEKPDIIHTHTAKAGAIGRMAGFIYKCCSGRRIAMVHTFHGNVFEGYFSQFKSKLFETIEKISAWYTDAVIAISPTQQWELVSKHRIVAAKKVHLINLGFDLSPFIGTKSKNRGVFRKRWGIAERSILIGIVGRLVPIKNHQLFLDAAKRLMEVHDNVPVQFVVVGDGELRDQLEDYARNIGLGDKIIFCGWQKDVHIVYADLDVLALTSFNEGTPVSIIEAMASEVPVITTDAGGLKDLLGAPKDTGSGSNGFQVCRSGVMCQKMDPTAFAEGIWFLCQDSNSKTGSRTLAAREHVRRHYSQDRLVESIEAIYEHLTGS